MKILKISDLPDLALPAEVAAVLRCSKAFIQNECKTGRMKSSKVAGKHLITQDAVRIYMEENRVIAPEDKNMTKSQPEIQPAFVDSDVMAEARLQRVLNTAKALRQTTPKAKTLD